ncbi:helix-turn-helix domain-containing protein [Sodalis sp.]|uniref:helix-turn-helix domain-containing protein n=1 Tax=Sodalis sp. (in: enterobacteria) TaxID=1898979 RepID=UPI003872B303
MILNFTTPERIKLMRESERMSRSEASKEWGLKSDALWRYETGKAVPNIDVVTSMLNHPRFEKYALWFTTEKIAPEAGQIAPALAHFGQENLESPPLRKNAG